VQKQKIATVTLWWTTEMPSTKVRYLNTWEYPRGRGCCWT